MLEVGDRVRFKPDMPLGTVTNVYASLHTAGAEIVVVFDPDPLSGDCVYTISRSEQLFERVDPLEELADV